MSEMKTWSGGCHCGRFRFEATSDLARVIECNCSFCSVRGALLTFVPAAQFKLTHGDEASLSVYLFNKKRIQHRFCPDCGVESFANGTGRDGQPMYAINVRCLDGIDLAALTTTRFDGRSL
jgi:hypothetical protein